MGQLLQIKPDGFYIENEKFDLISGDIHYFRIYPTEWRRHLLLAKDFGLNTIQTYVPWNLHEPKKGQFNFEGYLNLFEFMDLAAEMGFKVLLRPSPYICSECDFGGLPGWLYQYDLNIRCNDKEYLKHISDYYDVLIPKILPYLSTNGGPVMMVAVENEYGGSGYDREYLKTLADMLVDRGIDVPLYTTDNTYEALHMGSLPGIMRGANFRSWEGEATRFYNYTQRHFPEYPFFVGELWGGRQIFWGESYVRRDPEETARAYAECLKYGYVDFYMFSGGTNFGFFSGGLVRPYENNANGELKFRPHLTSYDEDAPVTETGLPTEKYYLCRNALLRHQGKPENNDRTLPFEYKTQSIKIEFSEYARLFDNLDNLTELKKNFTAIPTMEDMGQSSGFMLYSTAIKGWAECGEKEIIVNGVSDRLTVYDGEKYVGKIERDRENEKIMIDGTDRTIHLNMLLESVARINGGKFLDKDKKGILGYVLFQLAKLYGFEVRSLPMDDISRVEYKPLENAQIADNDPIFYRGSFDAQPGADTFLDMRGWGRGFVVVNGFNLGRFWEIGPQYTLYVPGGLLKEKDNEIVVFDVNHIGKAEYINTIEEHILETK